ncbi:cell division cycle-associated protein 7-like isoform X2 [Pleurodeles waltl]|uniref:cell division cycle-associated protein 7-like isoform X2 n=1 Tax=Pleurodeles waltl TaxID=8319 RepID=UPI0037094048
MGPVVQAKCLEPDFRSMNLSESSAEDHVTAPKQESRNNSRYSLRVVFKVPKKSEHCSSDEDEKPRSIALPQSNSVIPSIETKAPESSDSEEENNINFLEKREKNIQANKAMLSKLMADLEKLPGHLIPKDGELQSSGKKPKRPPRASLVNQEVRKNPERASRRQTRSMGGVEPSSPEKDRRQQLVKSLEYDLLKEEEAPKKRRSFRTNALTIPHIVRPVSEITQEELDNIASSVRDKIYHSVHGSTCHQCRQKTTDTKTNCRNQECPGIRGQFCAPCLRNRYGEEVREALLNPDWQCPPCRGICNCSFCRQRDGRCATGILFPLARYHGFKDVHSYLKSLRDKVDSDESE